MSKTVGSPSPPGSRRTDDGGRGRDARVVVRAGATRRSSGRAAPRARGCARRPPALVDRRAPSRRSAWVARPEPLDVLGGGDWPRSESVRASGRAIASDARLSRRRPALPRPRSSRGDALLGRRRHVVVSCWSSFTSRRRCALVKSRSASRDVYAGRKPIRVLAFCPSATQRKRRYLRNDGGASASCATQPSAAIGSASGCGIGTRDPPGELDDRRERQDAVADDVERPGDVAVDRQLERGDGVDLVDELDERVEAHHRGDEPARRGSA